MGLLLTGGILITFYILKLVCPQFIVGVAELPTVVKLGNFIDSNKFTYYLFNDIINFIHAYIYVCACCRVKKLSLKPTIILAVSILVLNLVSIFIPEHYVSMNYVMFILVPFLSCFVNKSLGIETFISTIVCFCVDIVSQVLSVLIRDVVVMSNEYNSATFLILLIDMLIWRTLLYLFFNDKSIREN